MRKNELQFKCKHVLIYLYLKKKSHTFKMLTMQKSKQMSFYHLYYKVTGCFTFESSNAVSIPLLLKLAAQHNAKMV